MTDGHCARKFKTGFLIKLNYQLIWNETLHGFILKRDLKKLCVKIIPISLRHLHKKVCYFLRHNFKVFSAFFC
jgi:hypothetical protein